MSDGPETLPASSEAGGQSAIAASWERLLGWWAVGLLLAFSTSVYAVFWAPKAVLLLIVVVPGWAGLAVAVRRSVPGARAAALFLAVGLLSALLADRVVLSLLGSHNWGTGWLFLSATVGAWALGTQVSEPGRRSIGIAVLAGAVVASAFAWVQGALDLPVDLLDDEGGRTGSLLGNPVHLGLLAAAGVWVAAQRFADRWRGWVPATCIALCAGAVQWSGSRVGLVPLVAVAGWWMARLRWRRGLAVMLLVIVGLAAAEGVARVAPDGSKDASATARAAVSLSPGATSGRVAVWRTAPEAMAARPILGWGPGRLQTAISPRVGSEVARFEGGGAEYRDAHNFLVEAGVTTGLLGALLLLAWLGATARRARGELAGFAAVVALGGLAQPLSVGLTPVAALALGVAAAGGGGHAWRPGERRVALVGMAAAAAVGAVFVAGQVNLATGALEFDRSALTRADRLSAPWPEVSAVQARAAAFEGISQRSDQAWAEAVEHARQAVHRDPADSRAWVNLADLLLRRGMPDAARDAYREALERHGWNVRALHGAVFFADRESDPAEVERLCARLEVVRPLPDGCVTSVRRIYGGEVGGDPVLR